MVLVMDIVFEIGISVSLYELILEHKLWGCIGLGLGTWFSEVEI